ncbi:MAG: biotin/lipoyl-binding protein [Gemmatimonadales bacterium]|nr:biotin/lipoyl-binding protein [Gemmatimonadales bacterium]
MKLKITLHGVAYEVDVEVLDAQDEMQDSGTPLPRYGGGPGPAAPAPAAQPVGSTAAPAAAPGSQAGPPTPSSGVVSPIAGTVLEVKCKVGDQVSAGQILVVIEAMKMETEIAAPGGGKIKAISIAPGDAVRENQSLVEFE